MFFNGFSRVALFAIATAFFSNMPFVSSMAQTAVVETHYAPTENLEYIDTQLLRSARKTIDFAAFTFTDFPVIDALAAAVRRGVKLRVLLDHSQLRQRDGNVLARLTELAKLAGVVIRIKSGRDLMHLKSFSVDNATLRTGSANFTASGLKRQNNDLIVIRDGKAAGRFQAEFNAAFERGESWP